jgi:hypothetical protein
LIVAAQCPSGGGAPGGAPGPGVPGGKGGEPVRKPGFDVVLKYYWKSNEIPPTGLKSALEKLKGVQSVELLPGTKTAVVAYAGKCEHIGALEAAAYNAGFPALVLNHAQVVVGLKPLAGGDPQGAAAALALVEGFHGINPGPAGLELHSDLRRLKISNLRDAVAKFKCEITVNQTFEYVSYKLVEGSSWDFAAAADAIRGVMFVRDEGENVVGLWINKAIVKSDQVEKLEGFKLERR